MHPGYDGVDDEYELDGNDKLMDDDERYVLADDAVPYGDVHHGDDGSLFPHDAWYSIHVLVWHLCRHHYDVLADEWRAGHEMPG